ncbi:hypothetical protein [Terasakiella sp. SH-1]|uniref:hypothetical protein n=1 Tax=Terasakiella sp. SH-1 TaxID=2560057 RepID=UPI0010746D9D|nr:hypothetical protein [Terasakiella sp. SH-1]
MILAKLVDDENRINALLDAVKLNKAVSDLCRLKKVSFFLLALLCVTHNARGAEQMPLEPANWRDRWPSDEEILGMNVLELTYIPDARKEPILRELLKREEWLDVKHFLHKKTPEADYPNQPWCDSVLKKLLSWDDVKIQEPAFVANKYGHEKFSDWRRQCPWMFRSELYNSTHNFRVYPFSGEKDRFIIASSGGRPNWEIDWLGNVKKYFVDENGREFFGYSGGGTYVFVDLNQCRSIGLQIGAQYDLKDNIRINDQNSLEVLLKVAGRSLALEIFRSLNVASLWFTEIPLKSYPPIDDKYDYPAPVSCRYEPARLK